MKGINGRTKVNRRIFTHQKQRPNKRTEVVGDAVPRELSQLGCAPSRSDGHPHAQSVPRTNVHVVPVYALYELPSSVDPDGVLARLLLRCAWRRAWVRLALAVCVAVDDVEGIYALGEESTSARDPA